MYSVEKCTGHSGAGSAEECEVLAGGGEGVVNVETVSEEVAAAVAAASEEIGDILKDELEADRADRIGAELADLSAELGLLAGLADGEAQPDFSSRFEVPFEWIALGERVSGSGSSSTSSSWSGARGAGRLRRPPRPHRPARAQRCRPIAKGKETSRKRPTAGAAAVRRAGGSIRVSLAEAGSDASDVGASDSDDQWTELDDASGSSDSSSVKETRDHCETYHNKNAEAEPPAMGQFLLPLLSEPSPPPPCLIRHEDILQLLAAAGDSSREVIAAPEPVDLNTDATSSESASASMADEPPVTPEEEAAILNYVCEVERAMSEDEGNSDVFEPVPEWLLGLFHSWGEISALMYTLIGANMELEMVTEEWVWTARFGCHCRLCVCLAAGRGAVRWALRALVTRLMRGGELSTAVLLMRALKLRLGAEAEYAEWDLPRLKRGHFPPQASSIVHDWLCSVASSGECANRLLTHLCECRPLRTPMEPEYAVARFLKLLENFKTASTINFKVDIIPRGGLATPEWASLCLSRLSRCVAPHQNCGVAQRLADMRACTAPHHLGAWAGYVHRCDCLMPRTLCAEQRKQLLTSDMLRTADQISDCGVAQMMEMDPDLPAAEPELEEEFSDSEAGSLGLSTSSSLDSNSELLLVAAAAMDSGGSEGEAAPGSLCRTVRHLMRSIASIERLMDRVLKHCDDWPSHTPKVLNDTDTRKRVDVGLSEVDRKLMAMYRRLPSVHRKQLQVYRKQKRLSTVCMKLVGGRAPAPPPPGPPPNPPPQPQRAPCPEYHLHRFREVRRKVMHMRDQQLYYHRLRVWLEDQLRQERDSSLTTTDNNVTVVDELPRRKKRTAGQVPRLSTAAKRKLKAASATTPGSKPHKILQMLRHKAPAQTTKLLTDLKDDDFLKTEEEITEAEPPEAFPLEKEENISDTDTIVGEKDDMCKDMKDCLAKFKTFALNNAEDCKEDLEVVKYPESVSPPLQEMSPTSSEPMPVYTAPKPSQRLLTANFMNRNICEAHEKILDAKEQSQITPDILNVPLNAKRTPLLYKDMTEEGDNDLKLAENENSELIVETGKDPNIYKYVTFGIEIKKAMEECQNIINSYNCSKDQPKNDLKDEDGTLSLEQICEVMMSLDKNSAEFLEKIDSDEPIDLTNNTRLAELVENMPQILANMPEIASKLSEFANASFELPEFATIMNSLPDVNNEAQLTPETLKQIRELKLNKTRDNVKVTKNTAKRKSSRKIKNNLDTNDIIGTVTFELDSKDVSEILKDEKEIQSLMKNKSNNKEDFKDLLFSISAQVVINKVFEYLKQNQGSELEECVQEDKDSLNSEMYSKASNLFDNSVKDALSMDELKELIKTRFNTWKQYVATKFQSIPVELLDNEIEAMLDKFNNYIQDLAGKQCVNDSDKIVEKIDELYKSKDNKESDGESCAASKESLKQITKLLSTSAGNTFDLLIMKLSKMSQDKKSSVKSLKFKYIDVIRRCAESPQLAAWIILDPAIAANVIQELTGLPIKKTEVVPDFNTMSKEKKKDYFIERLKEMNRQYMESLPKKALSGDEWLVMLYRLEQLEDKLNEACSKVNPAITVQANNASEAEILAAKGLSKIIGKSNLRIVKNDDTPTKETESTGDKNKELDNKESEDKKAKNEALLAKCEAILTSKGDKALLDSFYTIKSYITQGLPVPETYKKHVISICSSIDAKLLDEEAAENNKEQAKIDEKKEQNNEKEKDNDKSEKEKANLSVIGSQNPEMLAKYSAQALRNAKQTLNAVAFRNMMRNGQTKSESDVCDTPKTDCKWTNDCICSSCKDNDNNSVCLGDLVKQSFVDGYIHGKMAQEKELKARAKVAKPAKPTKCENTTHQQHVCKVGGGNNAGGTASGAATCAGDAGADQPCTCCYCTVFGHAPPLTTPVPRNFNETRERLRSILNKKKQKCKANGELEPASTAMPAKGGTAVPPKSGAPISAKGGTAVLPKSGAPVPPKTGAPVPPKSGASVPPKAPTPVSAKNGAPVPPKSGAPVPPKSGASVAPQTGVPVCAPPAPATVHPPHVHPHQHPHQHPHHAQPKPPALPKTLPPNLTAQQTAAQQKRQQEQQKQQQQHVQLAESMAKMAVSEPSAPKAVQRCVAASPAVPVCRAAQGCPAPAPPATPPTVKAEGKGNASAVDQIRLQQQLKQQQQAAAQAQMHAQASAQKQQQPAQKKPEPIYDLPIHNKPQLTPQQQQQVQQQMQQQQQMAARQRGQQRAVSLSSRDTSVFSTSSGGDGSCCWRGPRSEDPRDLDALLQYIEGPARTVDRGKKRAKKQRQKAKKMEAKLLEEKAELAAELTEMRREMIGIRAAHAAAKRRVEEVRKTLDQHKAKKKGKKQKLNPMQQAKVQQMAEQLGELTVLLNSAARELSASEQRVAEYSRRLADVDRQLAQAKAIAGPTGAAGPTGPNGQAHTQPQSMEQVAMLQKQQAIQQQQAMAQQLQRQREEEQRRLEAERQKQHDILNATTHSGGIVRVRRVGGDGVAVSLPGRAETPLATLLNNHRHLTVLNVCEPQQPTPAATKEQDDKKQTWEQALAHINQLAQSTKEKKKKEKQKQQEQAKSESAAKNQRSASIADPTQPLTKKQRRLLAKQQAEEEERRKQQEAQSKSKKDKKHQEQAKAQTNDTKKDKKAETEKKQESQKKKEDKKESKKEKGEKEKKGKENKQEKTESAKSSKQNKQQNQPAPSKKEKKEKAQRVSLPPDTTIEFAHTKNEYNLEQEKLASCSIMEQLSCGVQVADLRLPPGITLTRVQGGGAPPHIASVPAWQCSSLRAPPTPVARPAPVINADPKHMMFSTAHPEQPKTIIIPEPAAPQPPAAPAPKSKKAKKKAKKAAEEQQQKAEATKMVTLRNPMFHPNLPPVQISNPAPKQKQQDIRIPDPIPMPPNACQATITPTSNGMYTIRNPLMSMMHQQSLLGMRSQTPQMNMYNQPPYNYVNPNVYNPNVQAVPQTYVIDPSRSPPKNDEIQSRIMNLASFTQKNEEGCGGYSLFKTPDENQQRNFLTPEYYAENQTPKPMVSPNPIGTRPNELNRSFDSNDSSLFANPVQRPEPIGTPLKRDEERSDFSSLYTPFGQEDRNVFRNALFNDKNESNMSRSDELGANQMSNGDPLPYFQRLRVGSKLNNEVTIHHVTESKFYKGQEGTQPPLDESLFCRPSAPAPAPAPAWPDGLHTPATAYNNNHPGASSTSSPTAESRCSSRASPPDTAPPPPLPPAAHNNNHSESSVFLPDRSITNLSSLESSEREIESFKRFSYFFSPPHHKPKVQLDVRDIANALRTHHKP